MSSFHGPCATATDPDNELIEWELLAAPEGISVDAIRGTVRWAD